MTSWVPWSIFCVARCDALGKSQLSTKRQTGAIMPVFCTDYPKQLSNYPPEVGPSCFTVKHQKASWPPSLLHWNPNPRLSEMNVRENKSGHTWVFHTFKNISTYPQVYWITKIIKDTRLGQRQYMWRQPRPSNLVVMAPIFIGARAI